MHPVARQRIPDASAGPATADCGTAKLCRCAGDRPHSDQAGPVSGAISAGRLVAEPVTAVLQTLLVASFQNAGVLELVGRTANGLNPDYTLMTEVMDFQVEPFGPEPERFVVRVTLMMTLIRESDRRIVAARRFSTVETAASDGSQVLVGAFDTALRRLLPEIVGWTPR